MSFGLIFCYYIFKLQLTYIQFIVSSKIDCIQERIGHCTAVPNNNSVGYKIHHHLFYFFTNIHFMDKNVYIPDEQHL